jgi:hypothetical protein
LLAVVLEGMLLDFTKGCCREELRLMYTSLCSKGRLDHKPPGYLLGFKALKGCVEKGCDIFFTELKNMTLEEIATFREREP